jgi:hypothetical protein
MSLINSDKSLKVGDLVFQSYTKNNFLYKITNIEQRFLTKEDLRYGVYKDRKIGDEFNPIITIQVVADLDLKVKPGTKLRKNTKELDAAYLTKVDLNILQTYINRLTAIIGEFWT